MVTQRLAVVRGEGRGGERGEGGGNGERGERERGGSGERGEWRGKKM